MRFPRCCFGAVASVCSLLCACSATDKGQALADAGGTSVGPGGGTPSSVASDGFISAGPWQGYGFTATDPGAAIITPNCASGAACDPPFAGNTFCMKGTVTGRADYSGFAMLGWNLSQPTGETPGTWAVPSTGGITMRVSNDPPDTVLRIQLQGTDPHSSADRWCASLVSGQFTAWSAFKTNCWEGGSPQNPLTPGTPLQQGAVLVPGQPTALPFDVCLLGIEITP